jgi:ketosteroid isomerase-like protein
MGCGPLSRSTRSARPVDRRAIQAFNDNDLALASELVSDDVVYTFHGDHPAAGVYRGHAGFREVLSRAKELTNGTASLEPLAVVTNDEDALMVWGIFRGERKGVAFETHHAYDYRFHDGQLVEGHTVPADQSLANAFWSS